jgi:hypothetical protein
MTHQTDEPIEHLNLSPTARTIKGQFDLLMSGDMTADAPYQRGAVWTEEQRILLLKSIIAGTPIPALIIADRSSSPTWTVEDPYYAVIDGKQRLLTLKAWFTNTLAVPASWFTPKDVEFTIDTDDGPYVTFEGLHAYRVRWFKNIATIPVVECTTKSVQEEAEIYLRVNGAGTAQTTADLDRAREVTGARTNDAFQQRLRDSLKAKMDAVEQICQSDWEDGEPPLVIVVEEPYELSPALQEELERLARQGRMRANRDMLGQDDIVHPSNDDEEA